MKQNAAVVFVIVVTLVRMACASAAIPVPAKAAGYTDLTFSSTFRPSEVDVTKEGTPGHQWYLWSFFGKNANGSELKFNKNGTLTLEGGPTGPNGEIATAAKMRGAGNFIGTAFGGGAYFEATLAFRPQDIVNADYQGHPAFWAMALEHLVGYGQNKGSKAKRFEHFVEVDIFEYDMLGYTGMENVYGGALHDWYGIWHETCVTGLCSITNASLKKRVPPATDFERFHTYGLLWKPATTISPGYAQFYFDERPVGGIVLWNQCVPGSHPGDHGYSPFCVLDRQHLVLILGTGRGEPMTVRSVRVYQASPLDNIVKQ